MVDFRYIIVNTLHIDDDDDDDDDNNNNNSYIGIVATQCSLGTWFVSGK
jgi:hypothetical protein